MNTPTLMRHTVQVMSTELLFIVHTDFNMVSWILLKFSSWSLTLLILIIMSILYSSSYDVFPLIACFCERTTYASDSVVFLRVILMGNPYRRTDD